MHTLNTLHSLLDEALNINSVDTVFSTLYYTDLINGQRELWIRNEYNKNRSIDPNIQQELPCVEVELVDPHTCCIEVPIGCKLLRTKKQIPNTIEFNNSKGITSIGSVDITQKRFSIIDYSRVPYAGNGRFNKSTIFAFLYDRYIYLISNNPVNKLVQYISIRGLFSDPTELGDFIDCNNRPCWTPYDIYPINRWMWEYMEPFIVQKLLKKQVVPLDSDNNAKDDKTELTTSK